jgi:hypothetical protein
MLNNGENLMLRNLLPTLLDVLLPDLPSFEAYRRVFNNRVVSRIALTGIALTIAVLLWMPVLGWLEDLPRLYDNSAPTPLHWSNPQMEEIHDIKDALRALDKEPRTAPAAAAARKQLRSRLHRLEDDLGIDRRH